MVEYGWNDNIYHSVNIDEILTQTYPCITTGLRKLKNKSVFSRADLEEKNLTNFGLNFDGNNLSRANLKNANLDELNFYRGSVESSDLKGGSLKNLKGKESDFKNARLEFAKFQNATLENSDFSLASAFNANFQNANLKGIRFCGSWLHNCDFSGADLQGADFRLAEFDGYVNFNNAKLNCAVGNGTEIVSIQLEYPVVYTYTHVYVGKLIFTTEEFLELKADEPPKYDIIGYRWMEWFSNLEKIQDLIKKYPAKKYFGGHK